MGRYGEILGDMGRYGEIWGDLGRYRGARLEEAARLRDGVGVRVSVRFGLAFGLGLGLALGLGFGLGLGLGLRPPTGWTPVSSAKLPLTLTLTPNPNPNHRLDAREQCEARGGAERRYLG